MFISNRQMFAKVLLITLLFMLLNSHSINAKQAVTNNVAANETQNIVISKQKIVFNVDGIKYESTSQQPFIFEGRTYVSLRFASYLLENWVEWNPTNKTATISSPNELQKKQLQTNKALHKINAAGSSELETANLSTVKAYLNYGNIIIDDKQVNIPADSTTLLVDGTIYVPLRLLGELLKFQVDYDTKTRNITMKSINSSTNTLVLTDPQTPAPVENETNVEIGGGIPSASPVPSRDNLVSKVESELDTLRESFMAKGFALYESYLQSSDDAEKDKLYAKGLALLSEVEATVEEKLSKLDSDLKAQGYDIGTTSSDLRANFQAQKDLLLSQLNK